MLRKLSMLEMCPEDEHAPACFRKLKMRCAADVGAFWGVEWLAEDQVEAFYRPLPRY